MDESFLDMYLRYTEKQESPAEFHLWVGITMVAAAMGRKCYIERGYYRLYPNLFTILVAGSARCRKSTAIKIGVSLLQGVPTTRVISGKITPEKFIEEIGPPKGGTAIPNVLVHSGELSVFLTKQQYGEPLIHILTDMYDCPDSWSYKTKNRGEVTLSDLFLCIIAATTPDGVSRGIPPSALEDGFASRVLFVYKEDTSRRNAMPSLTPEEHEVRLELVNKLAEIGTMSGEFTLNDDARAWYIHWYENMKPPADKRMEGMWGRKHDHLLRVAMVLCGAAGNKVIEQHQLEAALLALEAVEENTHHALNEIGGDNNTQFLTRAATMVQRRVRIGHSELLRSVYPCRADVFKNIVETLIESGFMDRDVHKPDMYVWNGRPY
jgi:Protein of unknown function (DUF3987)